MSAYKHKVRDNVPLQDLKLLQMQRKWRTFKLIGRNLFTFQNFFSISDYNNKEKYHDTNNCQSSKRESEHFTAKSKNIMFMANFHLLQISHSLLCNCFKLIKRESSYGDNSRCVTVETISIQGTNIEVWET